MKTQSAKHITKKGFVLMFISAAAFLAMAIFGIVKVYDQNFSHAQATLIVFEGILGIALSFFPVVFYKLFKLYISFPIQMIIVLFMFMAMILGEAGGLYYMIPWWDSILHTFSGFGIAFVSFCLVNGAIKESNLKNKFAVMLIGAIAISLSIGLLWEIAEFSMDSFLGSNMQKVIPTAFLDDGQNDATLVGDTEEIAEFFTYASGYRYALLDTMKDIILCTIGTVVFAIIAFLSKKSIVYSNAFIKDNRALKEKTKDIGNALQNAENCVI